MQRIWLGGDREKAASLVPDEMVTQTSFLDTDSMVGDRIRAYRDSGISVLRADPAGKSNAEKLDTLGRFVALVNEVHAETL